jgi:hypothetical protein
MPDEDVSNTFAVRQPSTEFNELLRRVEAVKWSLEATAELIRCVNMVLADDAFDCSKPVIVTICGHDLGGRGRNAGFAGLHVQAARDVAQAIYRHTERARQDALNEAETLVELVRRGTEAMDGFGCSVCGSRERADD